MNSSDLDHVISEASGKGMYLVDHSNIDPLLQEYDDLLIEVQDLCDKVDDDSAPYASKYKARTLIDNLINKLDATRSIAIVEHNTVAVLELGIKLASLRVRTGIISWECEEPHNAQTDLELAAEYFFPGLVQRFADMSSSKDDKDDGHTNASGDSTDGAKKSPSDLDMDVPADLLPDLSPKVLVDAVKALNALGILWSGRGQIHKSVLYFLSSHKVYHSNHQQQKITPYQLKELGNAYTHTLFYLAQAYGHMGDTSKSCDYCHQTLQRQYQEGLRDIRSKLDWVKNCCGISDYYLAMKEFNHCALALASAEHILRTAAFPQIVRYNQDREVPQQGADERLFISGNLHSLEIEAELHRKWMALDVFVLKRAHDREKLLESARAANLEINAADAVLEGIRTSEEYQNSPNDFNYNSCMDSQASITGSGGPTTVFTSLGDTAGQRAVTGKVEFFRGVPVDVAVCSHLGSNEVRDFEAARQVFLRAATRIELAKKYYILDGYVTDHVNLTQEHSKLYNYLSVFESESKRKMAMHNRRFDLLSPFLDSLSRSSYEGLHKQISYELGECTMSLLEIKLDKFRNRDGEVNEKLLKKAEINKVNDICRQGLVMFAHFTCMYAPVDRQQHNNNNKSRSAGGSVHSKKYLDAQPLHALVDMGCVEPDESLISKEEVRPFLNAHFLSCRLMSKVVATPPFWPPGGIATGQRTHYMVACLRRYEWLRQMVPRLCGRHQLEVDREFGEEHRIVLEMCRLLPSKIDRMCYLGEPGLSL